MKAEIDMLNALYFAGAVMLVIVLIFATMRLMQVDFTLETLDTVDAMRAAATKGINTLDDVVVVSQVGPKRVSRAKARTLLERAKYCLINSRELNRPIEPANVQIKSIFDNTQHKSVLQKRILFEKALQNLNNFNAITNVNLRQNYVPWSTGKGADQMDPKISCDFCEERYYTGPDDDTEKMRILQDIKWKRQSLQSSIDSTVTDDLPFAALLAATERGIWILDQPTDNIPRTLQPVMFNDLDEGLRAAENAGWHQPLVLDIRPFEDMMPLHTTILDVDEQAEDRRLTQYQAYSRDHSGSSVMPLDRTKKWTTTLRHTVAETAESDLD